MTKEFDYDVIVIGAGHAGCEAALSAARIGAETLLLTINMDHIAQMSCNPAIGGIAKGHVTREIDALGGAQGRVTDAAAVQFRMLNITKGPAVWSPRSQCDKVCFQRAMKREVELQENLDVKQAMVTSFVIKDNTITGIQTDFEDTFTCRAAVITTGTFLNGLLHYGMMSFPGGRAGDPASIKLAENLKEQLGLRIGRLKTGTPPRILAKTIDFTQMEKQDAEIYEENFSYFQDDMALPRAERRDMNCFMTYTDEKTSQIIHDNIEKSPMFQGKIEGIGTRYCPSFEDKVIRFPHHPRHLLYLEPEGEFTGEYYINGISTSLPPEVQKQMIHSVSGMENAEISRYAYAIEYDFIFPDQLERSLRVKKFSNLFTAGQINGTSGYEEAAGQGLVAGMNAAKVAAGQATAELARDSSYIGVMIDDLVTKDIIEPYRLFTSRAEFRLRLRQDNADLRLCDFAHEHGLLPEHKYQAFTAYKEKLDNAEKIAKKERIDGKTLWYYLKSFNGRWTPDSEMPFPTDLLKFDLNEFTDRRAMQQLAIMAHYEGYLEREKVAINRLNRMESWKIPEDFDYSIIQGLRNEARTKLEKIRPTTLSQAGRINGVNPPELALLQVHLKRAISQQKDSEDSQKND
jgi:tRNA uridine 5-carboxymethylaminomethyl modification enzyme